MKWLTRSQTPRRPAGCSEAREAIGTLPIWFPPPSSRRIPDRPCRAKTGGTDEIVRVRRSELPDRVVDQEDACGRSSCT